MSSAVIASSDLGLLPMLIHFFDQYGIGARKVNGHLIRESNEYHPTLSLPK
jgi:hypothetical protein